MKMVLVDQKGTKIQISGMRISEPFVKASLALWLVDRGATQVRISVDGAEIQPDQVRRVFRSSGYSHQAAQRSCVKWTGEFVRDAVRITVVSRPGVDVIADLPDGTKFLAECKGEPSRSGVEAGADLTSLYNALGQLIRHSGEMSPADKELCLVAADTERMRKITRELRKNPAVAALQISILLVNAEGHVATVRS
jgi:hypothetical protein